MSPYVPYPVMTSPRMPSSRVASPGIVDNTLPFHQSPSVSDFEVLRSPSRVSRKLPQRRNDPEYDPEVVLRANVSRLMAAQLQPSVVCGRIPLDPLNLTLFFRSKNRVAYSLDFPIDVEDDTPPALDVLIAACRTDHLSDIDDSTGALFYPPNLPITTSVELANHPILDAVRNTLYPTLQPGHYLTAVRDKLELVVNGGRMVSHTRVDGRAATVVVTLPVRFRGGAQVVNGTDRFYGRGGKSGDMEWVAFTAPCSYEVETVTKGCRMSVSYALYVRSFGASGLSPDPLITPSDSLVALISPILNLCRGRRIGFFLHNEQSKDPSELMADSLVPGLKGSDSLLYHALKLFKLNPELHWTAGGYIWPVDTVVEVGDDVSSPISPIHINGRGTPAMRGAFAYGGPEETETDILRERVEASGAVPLTETDILILSDPESGLMPAKERVPFVARGELNKLVVNVLMVSYVP